MGKIGKTRKKGTLSSTVSPSFRVSTFHVVPIFFYKKTSVFLFRFYPDSESFLTIYNCPLQFSMTCVKNETYIHTQPPFSPSLSLSDRPCSTPYQFVGQSFICTFILSQSSIIYSGQELLVCFKVGFSYFLAGPKQRLGHFDRKPLIKKKVTGERTKWSFLLSYLESLLVFLNPIKYFIIYISFITHH